MRRCSSHRSRCVITERKTTASESTAFRSDGLLVRRWRHFPLARSELQVPAVRTVSLLPRFRGADVLQQPVPLLRQKVPGLVHLFNRGRQKDVWARRLEHLDWAVCLFHQQVFTCGSPFCNSTKGLKTRWVGKNGGRAGEVNFVRSMFRCNFLFNLTLHFTGGVWHSAVFSACCCIRHHRRGLSIRKCCPRIVKSSR